MPFIVRVWDAPTRLFHWLLLLCVVGLIVSGQVGGGIMVWHFRLGYCVLTLLLFRLTWGFVGGHWSRFGSFLYHPARVLRYVLGQADRNDQVGHNPLGALSVFALLFVLALQVSSGLFSDDEIAASGPLARHASTSLVQSATFYHKQIGKPLLLLLVALHLGAIGYYRISKKENLVKPMITGDKALPFPAQSAIDGVPERRKAAVILTLWGIAVASFIIAVS